MPIDRVSRYRENKQQWHFHTNALFLLLLFSMKLQSFNNIKASFVFVRCFVFVAIICCISLQSFEQLLFVHVYANNDLFVCLFFHKRYCLQHFNCDVFLEMSFEEFSSKKIAMSQPIQRPKLGAIGRYPTLYTEDHGWVSLSPHSSDL